MGKRLPLSSRLLIWGAGVGCATFAIPPTATCHGAPPQQRTAPEVPSAAPPSPASQAGAPAALPTEVARELSVQALVQHVLARNPSLAQMTAAWQAASARYPQVTSLDDPMFGTMVAPASIGSRDVEFGYRVEASQKFPWPGKLALRGANAQAEAGAARYDIDNMRLQLVESAKDAFYEYFLVARALAVNDESLRLLREIRQNALARGKTAVTEQDVLQADVEIGRQQERQITLERMRRVAVARINTLMHLPTDAPLPPPPEELGPGEAPPDVRRLQAAAVASRPDLRALEERVAVEKASLGLAHKEFCPDVEVTAAYDTIMGNGPTRDLAPQVGVRVNLPVRYAKRYGMIAEAEARLAQRSAELARQTDLVNFEVRQAYEQVTESDRIARLYEQTILPAARNNFKAAQAAYATGRVPFLSLIEAQRNVVMLRDRYYEAVADSFRRRAALERATGGPAVLEAPGRHR
jgi:outer membrane protein TolC